MTRPTRYRAYGQNIPLIDIFPFPIMMTRAPTGTDRDFEVGQVWVYNSSPTTRQVYVFCGFDSSQDAIWVISGPGASDVDILGCDTGDDPVAPIGGKIDLLGTPTQIISTGNAGAGSITFSLADALEIVTSLDVPLILAGSSGSLDIKLGDNAGATALNILDSDNATVASISSDGDFSFNSLTVTNLTATGTTQILGNNSSASTVSLATGTGGNTVNINNGANSGANVINMASGAVAAASTVNILSGVASTGVLALNLNTGTGSATSRTTNIGTGAAVVNAINIGGTGANVIALGNTQTAGSVSIANAMVAGTVAVGGSSMTGTITLGASTAGQTINMGAAINTGAQIINVATGASGADSTVNILSGNGTAGTQTLNALTGTRAGALNLGTGAAAHVISIGSNSAGAVTLSGGAAGMTIQTANGALAVTSGTGAMSISADAAATTLNIGTGAAAKTVTLGSTNATSTTTIQSGSGGITMTGVTTHNSNVLLNGAATQLQVHGGAVTDFIGTATLSSGTVTVANTNIDAGDRIFLTYVGSSIADSGQLSYSISAGASFTIESTNAADANVVAYFIVRQLA